MNRDLFVVAASLMLWGLGEGMFFAFQPIYLQQLGADPIQIGAILGLVGIAMTIAHLPAGYLADRLGRRPLMWMAWILGTLATVLMALAGSLPVFAAGSVIYGLTTFVSGPMNGYITNVRGSWSVARALTLISAFYNVGSIAGPLIGGWIGSQVGLKRTFGISALLFILSTITIFFIRPQPVDKNPDGEQRVGVKKVLSRPFSLFLVVFAFSTFMMYLPQPLTVNFLQSERGISLQQIGQLLALRGIGIVLLNLALGQLNPRYGYMLAQVSMAIYSGLLWFGTGLPWYGFGFLLLGSFSTARLLAIAQGRALVKAAEMSVAYGLIETANAAAIIMAPPLAGLIYTKDPIWIFPFALAGIGAALAAVILIMPRYKTQE